MYMYIVLTRIVFSIKSEITIIIKINKFKKGSGFFFWRSKIQNYFMVFNRQCTECIHLKNHNLLTVILRDIFLFRSTTHIISKSVIY